LEGGIVKKLRIEMLPAEEGDALWVEYGDPTKPRRLLIDGGVLGTHDRLIEKIEGIEGKRRFELIMITHIDNDHIDAMVKLLGEDLELEVEEFWFNAWEQIKEADTLGVKQGEMLTEKIAQRGYPHHQMSGGKAIAIPSDPGTKLPVYKLEGGMTLTILGPTAKDLGRLKAEWKRTIENAGLVPGGEFTGAKLLEDAPRYQKDRLGSAAPNVERWANRKFSEDPSAPNASSISFLAEYGNRSVLFTGDARSGSLIEGIDRLLEERGISKLKIDAFKVPHHGSKNNLSNEVMERIDSKHFLLSSSGAKFNHPDSDAVARIIFHSEKPTLHFNYFSKDNKDWDRTAWKSELGYDTVFPDQGQSGLVVEFDVKDT
jgi:beta-lactamase superfamily II metal-dependent hydrolase